MIDKRTQIEQAVAKFIALVQHADGVLEVALFGSAATGKAVPDDFDLMVFIEDEKCIPRISKSIRRTSSIFHAHDVFLFDANRQYLGRICQRKECPTNSVECKVTGCGKIKYLKMLERFKFDEQKALTPKPICLWTHPSQEKSISQQWYEKLFPK